MNFIFTSSILTAKSSQCMSTELNSVLIIDTIICSRWAERRIGLLKFNYGFAKNLAQDSKRQKWNYTFKKLHLFSLCLCLSWDLPVSSWNRKIELKTVESHDKIVRLERSVNGENNKIIWFHQLGLVWIGFRRDSKADVWSVSPYNWFSLHDTLRRPAKWYFWLAWQADSEGGLKT